MKKIIITILTIFVTLTITGCTSSSSDPLNKTNSKDYPIIIEHAFGKTAINQKSQRIVTVGWGNHDVALALGVSPVGLTKGNFGKLTKEGLAIWSKEALSNNQPAIFDEVDGLDFEAISNANPDMILATYSGITKEDYQTLSMIAPVVAYPDKPWQTLWRQQTTISAKAMGLEKQGQELVKETEQLIAEKLQAYPQLKEKTAAFIWVSEADTSKFYVYLAKDPRVAYLKDLGLSFPKELEKLAKDADGFYLLLSSEHVNLLNNVDILVTYGTEDTLNNLKKDKLFGKVPAIKRESVVVIANDSNLATAATPTVLSIRATIDEYLQLLGKAASKVN